MGHCLLKGTKRQEVEVSDIRKESPAGIIVLPTEDVR
jgi:hypothetical protein